MALQADCSLTYAGNNIYIPTYFCQALLQGHILAIPDPDVPTGLSPILTPPSSAGPSNAQQRDMRIQVLLSMGQDRLSKEEVTELLYQRVQVLTSTQELHHSTRNWKVLSVFRWVRDHITLTASSGNMARPSQGILSLGQI